MCTYVCIYVYEYTDVLTTESICHLYAFPHTEIRTHRAMTSEGDRQTDSTLMRHHMYLFTIAHLCFNMAASSPICSADCYSAWRVCTYVNLLLAEI